MKNTKDKTQDNVAFSGSKSACSKGYSTQKHKTQNYKEFTKKTQDTVQKTLCGQASMIDLLILGLFISILLVVGMYSPTFFSAQTNREEANYAESMMLSFMNYRNSTYGSFNNTGNMSIAEAINLYMCKSLISEADINITSKYLLDSLVKPSYNYIFFTSANMTGGPYKSLWVWNSQSDVCTSSITLSSFNLTLACPTDDSVRPLIGIWPKWKVLPPKSGC